MKYSQLNRDYSKPIVRIPFNQPIEWNVTRGLITASSSSLLSTVGGRCNWHFEVYLGSWWFCLGTGRRLAGKKCTWRDLDVTSSCVTGKSHTPKKKPKGRFSWEVYKGWPELWGISFPVGFNQPYSSLASLRTWKPVSWMQGKTMWAMKRSRVVFSGICWVWNTTQLCGDYSINLSKDPY